MSEKCIAVEFVGGTEYVALDEFIAREIQDDDLGEEIARKLLDWQFPYPWNEDSPGEFFRQFSCVDDAALAEAASGTKGSGWTQFKQLEKL